MRLCTSLPPCLAAAAAVTVLAPVPSAVAHAGTPPPACVAADAHAFPLVTRIRGGPGSYEAGGGYGTWYVDLTNTTGRICTGVHPLIVLVDDNRALRPDQPQLDFYDGSRARPVTFEGTDEQELIGVLDATGFAGFAVPPGGTVSVKVRLALPSDVAPDRVTVNAAVVQRRGDDGDWVGESDAYRFAVSQDGHDPPPDPQSTRDGGSVAPSASGSPQATPGAGTATPVADSTPTLDPAPPSAQAAGEAGSRAGELSRTGPGSARALLAAAAALTAVGAGALLARRRG
ncbi:hypothetical protein [Streptomyces alanosinicus]|uniref:Gram-positive cocci surface proteins LPxTG domain-containing protein n=2 Tax=Streptomyces alanosinicus TaxID=68171 RepID=A0A918YCW5_9ACTN|nr:hypothetical protein [Streptomyces alanosinicus]GHD99428.1 hypothetical protein GCM10010339_10700 [Streptomyces alanosinicus]